MKVKNNTNGKQMEIAKAKFDLLSQIQKSNFTILDEKDFVEVVQVVENLVENKKEISTEKKSKKNIEPEAEIK